MDPQSALRWNCLNLAAQMSREDSVIDDVIRDAARLLLFVMQPPATSPATH